MAGKFEAPKGRRGNIPQRTDRRPGDEIHKSEPAGTDRRPRRFAGEQVNHRDGNTRPEKMPPLRSQSAGKRPAQRNAKPKKKKRSILPFLITFLILAMVAGLAFVGFKVYSAIQRENNRPATAPDQGVVIELPTEPGETEPPTTETTALPEPEHVVSTVSIGAVGDLLMHKPIVDNAWRGSSWDFSDIFRYLTPYVEETDYAVGNLETTFGGEGFPYQGNPAFNTPDIFAKNVKDAGFDMLLTANNHCYDTLMTGVKRTLEVSREAGLKTIGTRLSEDESRYEIVELNGIRVGMICYSYSHGRTDSGVPRMNVNTPVEQPALVNYFYQDRAESFYAEVEPLLQQMRDDGAEAIVFFIHWGVEYQLAENSTQDAIAQKLCDLGVDVIVGGHPHVVQPMMLLTSQVDSEHKTVCVYSLGNIVSNQRLGNISTVTTAHTEDGAMFTVTFEKYSDGTVYLSSVDLLPTWVNMYIAEGRRHYDILPLDEGKQDTWQKDFALSEAEVRSCQNSYSRTMNIMGSGLTACKDYLQNQKQVREEYYYNLAMGTLDNAA